MMTDFDNVARSIQVRRGWKQVRSLNNLVDAWVDLIEQCEEGYELGYDEWMNDAASRHILEDLVQISGFPGTPFGRLVADADERLRRLFIAEVHVRDDSWPWWLRGVLSNASTEYQRDIRERFGVSI